MLDNKERDIERGLDTKVKSVKALASKEFSYTPFSLSLSYCNAADLVHTFSLFGDIRDGLAAIYYML